MIYWAEETYCEQTLFCWPESCLIRCSCLDWKLVLVISCTNHASCFHSLLEMNPCVETCTVKASKEGRKMDAVCTPNNIRASSSAKTAAEGIYFPSLFALGFGLLMFVKGWMYLVFIKAAKGRKVGCDCFSSEPSMRWFWCSTGALLENWESQQKGSESQCELEHPRWGVKTLLTGKQQRAVDLFSTWWPLYRQVLTEGMT